MMEPSKANSNNPRVYQNIMEILVHREIQRQIKGLPKSLRDYINQVEVATFALNRLPPLYASSEKGKHQQELKGKSELQDKIAVAVRQALAAINRDPLRMSTPIADAVDPDLKIAQDALREVEQLLRERQLIQTTTEVTWQKLPRLIDHALRQIQSSAPEKNDHHSLGREQAMRDEWNERNYYR